MKKILAALLVLAFAIPAMADVAVTAVDNGGGQLLITVTPSGGAVVRGVSLVLEETAGDATVASTAAVTATGLNTFIDYAMTAGAAYTAVGQGHPAAKWDRPGGEAVFPADSAKFSLCAGYLDENGVDPKGEGLTGVSTFSVTYTQGTTGTATIAMSLDSIRGNIVGDTLGNVTVQASQVLTFAPPHTVSTPTTPTVPGSKFYHTQGLPASTGGSVDSQGHGVQYQFDWGDGTFSTWGTGLKVVKAYALAAGTSVTIKAKARCATDNLVESAWSAGLTFTIGSECQKYNLSKRINGATDNLVNATDVNALVGFVNANRSASSSFTTLVTHPNHDYRYNFDTSTSIAAGDLNALVGYVNAARTNSAAFSRSCPNNP